MGPIEPDKTYLLKGSTIEELKKKGGGDNVFGESLKVTANKEQIAVREDEKGFALSFANPVRFKSVRNGVVKTFEIPAQETAN